MHYVALAVFLLIAELAYLGLARRFGWLDRPTARGLHGEATVRGGGVIIWLAAAMAFFAENALSPWALVGLTVIAAVSFADDLRSQTATLRLTAHALGVTLLAVDTPFGLPGWAWPLPAGPLLAGPLVVLAGVALLNGFNFMDGVNGMTALYGLVTVGTLVLWSQRDVAFRELGMVFPLLPYVAVALAVFGWFNIRKKAVCFAGDVGSVTLAGVVFLALLAVCGQRQSLLPLFSVALYATDAGLTLLGRIIRRESLIEAHRQHLFQQLVSRRGWSHLRVSATYAGLQAIINVVITAALGATFPVQLALAAMLLVGLVGVYYVALRHCHKTSLVGAECL